MRKLTTKEFIEKAKEKYGNKFSYEKVNYIGADTRVIITCREHGDFETTPTIHLNKNGKGGCSECRKESIKKLQSSNTEEFIRKSKEKFGNKFSYDKVNYINNHTEVIVTCRKHGDFKVTPQVHLKAHGSGGCKECKKERTSELKSSNTEEFIRKSKEKFGDKFSYDKVNYIKNEIEVTITCHEHGDFEITPKNHLKSKKGGCKKCQGNYIRESKLSTTEEFIKRSKEIYGNKFNYNKTVYKGSRTNVIITCLKHGDFKVTPDNHLHEGRESGGCKECGKEYLRKANLLTTEEFIRKSKEKFGNKFSYDKVNYIDGETEVIVTCHKHGDFEVSPYRHLKAINCGGCKECRKERLREVNLLTTGEFIKRSKERFGDKFSYDRTNYEGKDTRITVTCNEHGDFLTTPHIHLNPKGRGGCPYCDSSRLEDEVRRLLTENKFRFEEQKPFPWLVGPGGRAQTLDFYLTDLGIGIECQGGQHFYAVDFFGGEEGFKNTQERDQNKLKLCEEHRIKLMYYSNLSTPDKPFDYPYPVYEDGTKLIEKLMSMLNDDTDAEDTAQN